MTDTQYRKSIFDAIAIPPQECRGLMFGSFDDNTAPDVEPAACTNPPSL